MKYTITISEDSDAKLRQRASAAGAAADEYLEELVQNALSKPSLREILGPIHDEFIGSGTTEDELDSVLADALQQSRRERRARRGA